MSAMLNQFFVTLQNYLPQHVLSQLAGALAESRTPWLKNVLIQQFMRAYPINMQLALQPDPYQYASFNDFFTRKLNPIHRPISAAVNSIACPVDGTIAAIGDIQQNQLIQAKGAYFNLEKLCGDQTIAAHFYDGRFATFYLAPHNYHRIHMPIKGRLLQTIYIPGRLFSVNRVTTALVPELYSRNERLVCLFETDAGYMAVILVGAMIVGSMQTVWMTAPVRSPHIQSTGYEEEIILTKGSELGLFKLGSTVITLFQPDHVTWADALNVDASVEYGQNLGFII